MWNKIEYYDLKKRDLKSLFPSLFFSMEFKDHTQPHLLAYDNEYFYIENDKCYLLPFEIDRRIIKEDWKVDEVQCWFVQSRLEGMVESEFQNSMYLVDKFYEDENGNRVDAEHIDSVSTYQNITDGFFTYRCPDCRNGNFTRGYKINGVVYICPVCHAKVLILSSNIKINEKVYEFISELKSILSSSIENKEETLGKIQDYYAEYKKEIKKIFDSEKNE